MSGRDNRPVSRRIRQLRGRLSERRSRRRSAQLQRRARVERTKQRVRDKVEPVTSEVEAVRTELGELQEDLGFDTSDDEDGDADGFLARLAGEANSSDDKSEQAEERGGSVLGGLLGVPAQRADLDGDGDDDLGLFFGVDGEANDTDGPDPFAAFEDAPGREVEEGDSGFTQTDAGVFDAVAEFEQRFEPAPDPFGEDDGMIDPFAALDEFEERER